MARFTTATVRGLVLGLAAAGALTACGTAEGAEQEPVANRQAKAWTEPASYTYTVHSTCGERAFLGKFRVSVAAGKVTKAEGLDESGKRWVAEGPKNGVPTLAGLVTEAEDARKRSADVATVDTDPVDLHPTKITIDLSKNSIDDEICYAITDYRTT